MVVKNGFFILIVVTLSSLIIAASTFAAMQKSWVLDLDSPVFMYEERQFNDSNYSQQYDFNASGFITYWVTIPKNSTIVNASLDVTGKIVPIYKKSVPFGILGISIGNVTEEEGNETVTGTNLFEGSVKILLGDGTLKCGLSIFGSNTVPSTAIGNVTPYPGNEIVVGVGDAHVYVLEWTGECNTSDIPVWNFTTGGDVNSVYIGDLDGDSINEVIVGSGDGSVYALDNTGQQIWSKNLGAGTIYSVVLGNVTSDSGNEIVVGATEVFVLNSTGSVLWNVTLPQSVYSVDIGNVNSNPGNEIVVGTQEDRVYLINASDTSGITDWDFTTGGDVKSVIIEDVVDESVGNEIVAGSDDKKIYTLDNSGSLIWDFETQEQVKTVSAGNLTGNPGNEVAAGDKDGFLYTFNFDFFPTNLTLDVGNDGDDWFSSYVKLRVTETASGFASAIQNSLNVCTPDANGNCAIPLVFTSEGPGRLNISALNITYDYNASPGISYNLTDAWSRTSDILVNESVGNQVKNVTYNYTANNIEVRYIKINSSALECDFDGAVQSVTDIYGDRVCDVPDFTVPKSGSLPDSDLLWDDTMGTGIPVIMTIGSPYNTTDIDNYFWRKPFNISNTTSDVFYNVTANISILDGSEVKGLEFLNVFWNGSWCDITPTSEDFNCDTNNPTYDTKTCGSDTFSVCKKDTNSDNVIDFFKWKQPYLSSDTNYETGGSTNLEPVLSNKQVTPPSDIWGTSFNYSVFVNDTEGDNVNVTLWVYLGLTDTWINEGTVTVSGVGNAIFVVTSNKDWTGSNDTFLFEYQDFNSTGSPIHSPKNTTPVSGPTVLKHNISVIHITGNSSEVNRSEYVLLEVRVNDTNTGQDVGGVLCSFWVTVDGVNFNLIGQNTTNASGYCQYSFSPNGSYAVGNQIWKAGVYQDNYYNDFNSSDFDVKIKGMLNISLTKPYPGYGFYRNSLNLLEAKLIDQYSVDVSESGYNCTFLFNNSQVGNSTTGSSGYCNITWTPNCSYSLSNYPVTVILTRNASEFYTIIGDTDSSSIDMRDTLTVSITNPSSGSLYHKKDVVELNSTVGDSCLTPPTESYNIKWYLKWKQLIEMVITETAGISRINEPVIISGSELESQGINLSEWRINYTKVIKDGVEVPSEVKAWTNESKTEINTSQVYLSNYSELVFLINPAASETKTYRIYYNESNPSSYDISYILNSGFESGELSPWGCVNTSCAIGDAFCNCEIADDNEINGNYSLYLSSGKSGVYDIVMGIQQNLSTNISSDYIKIRFKAWGEYNSGSYLRLEAGGGRCDLTPAEPPLTKPTSWNTTVCYNASFYNANSINITVHDDGDAGNIQDASHVHIDYLCIADSSGNCITYDSGGSRSEQIISRTLIGSSDNDTRQIQDNETLGLREIVANASGVFYEDGQESVSVFIYGWSNVSEINISSSYCIALGNVFECMQNATMDILCRVIDSYTSNGIENYNVDFYNDTGPLGSDATNQNGVATMFYQASDALIQHNITCNITDQPSIYYDATASDSKNLSFNVVTGNTTGELLQMPQVITATDITKDYNYTFTITLVLNNTGNGTMYNPNISISAPQGIFVSSLSCPPVQSGYDCSGSVDVKVTVDAVLGSNNITVNATWNNADSTLDSAPNQTAVFVENNTALNIIEAGINYTVIRGSSNNTQGFTVESFGNTELNNITFDMQGENASELSAGWIAYNPANISTIPRNGSQAVIINITVPLNATEGVYLTNITANATGSQCSASECWDSLLLNITVTRPDWERTPENMSKTIGLSEGNGTVGTITVTNNRGVDYSFNITVIGNGTGNITVNSSVLNVSNQSSGQITVYHNTTSGYQYGKWYADVIIKNLNGATPAEINTSVILNVINLTVDIVSPNQSSPAGPINSSSIVNITVNVTLNFEPLNHSMNWSVGIGGEECPLVSEVFNNITSLWNISCAAPVIPGNPINNTLRVIGNYTLENMSISDYEANAVVYEDITAPQFSVVTANSVNYEDNVSPVLIYVDITDNTAVDTAWAVVSYLGINISLNPSSISGDTYTFSFSNPNNVTDYDITIFANDTYGQENSTTGWFEVYLTIQFYGNSTNARGDNVSSIMTFYRPGTNRIIHQFSVNLTSKEYNFTVHKRNYDLEVKVFNHTIKFNNVNITLSAINQWNSTTPTNITNPVYFDNVGTSPVSLQDTTQHKLLAVAIENILSYDNVEFALNYSQYINLYPELSEPKLHIYKCSAWNFSDRAGCDGNWEDLGGDPDSINHVISLSTSSASAFTVAEYCPSCPGGQDEDQRPTGDGGTGPGPGPPTAVCGNNVCEVGENQDNCPQDCLKEAYPFSIRTTIGDIRIRPGENKTYLFSITNKINRPISVLVSVSGDIEDFIKLGENTVDIDPDETEEFDIYVSVPSNIESGVYTGIISATSEGKTQEIPITLRISLAGESFLSLIVDLITKEVPVNGDLKLSVEMRNIGYKDRFNVTLIYLVKNGETEEVVKEENETLVLEEVHAFIKTISLRGVDIPLGDHFIEVWAEFEGKSVKSIESFKVVESFFDTPLGRSLFWLVIAVVLGVVGLFGFRRYKRWVKTKARYVFPVNYNKVPRKTENSFWLGTIAETDKKAWFDPNDLTTHVLVAGSTGSGKSVGASVFVEEALEQKIPVIAFDPTAQWTGFVKACKDENLLRYYDKFGMDRKNVKPYKGMIFEVTDPKLKINFKEFMNPGEITVFTLNKLKPGQYDEAVQNIIDAIFAVGWEESTELKMIIVFDEVHRLLEKYGGKGGYIALEKACREFRKWGIGLIMCSQVLADFKEAVAGNVLTDIQLNTKSITDIKKAEDKYGAEYARRISRQAIGVGMLQNPKYNEGKPYFVNFRPTYHNPHKITNEEMEIYKEFAKRLGVVEKRINEIKASGKDTFDIELELRLAKDKLKLGRFKMAKIYTTSLEEHLNIKSDKK